MLYIIFLVVNSTPPLNDLYQHITTDYATEWKTIGILLGLPSKDLGVIEAAYSADVKWCCNQMLKKWLEIDTTASWEKLLTVIKSSAVSSASDKGDYHCIILYLYYKLEITNVYAYCFYWQAL